MSQDIEALAKRLEESINADKIYDWIVRARKATKSDFPRIGFANEMELIDEERKESAAALRAQQAEIERMREHERELHGQLMRMIDRWEAQREVMSPDSELDIKQIVQARVRLCP